MITQRCAHCWDWKVEMVAVGQTDDGLVQWEEQACTACGRAWWVERGDAPKPEAM
jgi:hypothetical protein